MNMFVVLYVARVVVRWSDGYEVSLMLCISFSRFCWVSHSCCHIPLSTFQELSILGVSSSISGAYTLVLELRTNFSAIIIPSISHSYFWLHRLMFSAYIQLSYLLLDLCFSGLSILSLSLRSFLCQKS
jgi:hypothetical protein